MSNLATETGDKYEVIPASAPSATQNKCVMVLDDDDFFQELMAGILSAHGYDVWAARNAEEASAYFAARQPDLAIVDYSLPGMDGLTWISQLRESGKKTPVIFVSGTWCDAKTFNWLRNILNVSLVFQKPIDPQLFLHALADILQPQAKAAQPPTPQKSVASATHTEYVDLIRNANLAESLAKLDRLIDSPDSDAESIAELIQMRRKVRTEQAVQSARGIYSVQLPAIWSDLVGKINEARTEQSTLDTFQTAFALAHKIKGTSGSHGLPQISDVAGQIEKFLNNIDPASTPEEKAIFWSEILHLTDRGTEIVGSLSQVGPSTGESSTARSMSLLLVSPKLYYQSLLAESVANNIDVHLVGSANGAVSKAKAVPLDAAVIDLSLNMPGLLSSLTRSLRSIRQCSQLPFIFIANPSQYRNISELIYAGCSALLEPPVSEEALNDAVGCIREAIHTRKKRILCVDDDDLLTYFLSSLLNESGFKTKELCEPIHILETLESFQPDLILLDVMMPGLSGYEVCRTLRAHKEWAHIPVIFLTAKTDADSRAAAFQAGGNDFLAKPVVAHELLARVNAQLALVEQEKRSYLEEATGVLQWKPFKTQATGMLQKCLKQNSSASLGVIVVENFDKIDDQHGGYSQQQVLAELGQLISIRFRTTDIRGMMKPGTFVVAFPGEKSATTFGALTLLQQEFAQLFFTGRDGGHFQNGLRIGLADAGPDGLTFESLTKVAISRAWSTGQDFSTPARGSNLWRLPVHEQV